MTKKQKIVTCVLIFNSLFISFVLVMSKYSGQRLWSHLCLVAAILELAIVIVYYCIVVKGLKKNPPPLS